MAENLGWYVYALRDPDKDNRIFYVGEGVGDRVHQRAKAASGDWQVSESR